jgi:anion-transporting  ArsA/GET3 family ATPase
VVGGGGVGKTTIAAALAVAAAQRGQRSLVVTVDPAKRLANALGLDRLGSDPQPTQAVPGMWAAMLDAEASWTKIIRRHAPPDVAERLLASEFFDAVAARFPSSQSYAAAEEMTSLVDTRAWDLVIVDTPPAAGGIGFFTAPADMNDLVGGNVLKWLTGRGSGRRSVYSLAGKPTLRVADSILGSDLLQRVAEFLVDLRTTYDGIQHRARDIESAFRNTRTAVVATADPTPLREAARFYRELPAVAAAPSVVIFNRALPASWTQD